MKGKIFLPTQAESAMLLDAANRVFKMKGGPGVNLVNTPYGITIGLAPSRDLPTVRSSSSAFLAKITVATAVNGGIRWKYTLRIGHWDMTMSPSTGGTWVDDSNGVDSFGWNSAEDMNIFTSGSGAIGTGNTNVAQADGTVNEGSCKLVPLPVGGYVACVSRGVDTTAATHYTIINFANSAQ